MSVYKIDVIIKKINKINKKIMIEKIKVKEFIDNLMKKFDKYINHIPNYHDSKELCLEIDKEYEYYIHSVTQDEKVEWKKIYCISKHPSNGDLVKVKTKSGRKIITTKSHSHLKKIKEGKIEPIRGDELKIGDKIPISKNFEYGYNNGIMEFGNYKLNLTEELGLLFGLYLSDDNINNNDIIIKQHLLSYYGENPYDKHIPDYVNMTNINFVRGIIKGYFDNNSDINNKQ
jgi:DNA-directed RNA polymerase subunit A"